MLHEKMKSYPIERSEFCDLIDEIFDKSERFIDCMIKKFGYFNHLDELATDNYETINFKFWRWEDDFIILNKKTGEMILWYKHYGRALESNMTSYDRIKYFLIRFLADILDTYDSDE